MNFKIQTLVMTISIQKNSKKNLKICVFPASNSSSKASFHFLKKGFKTRRSNFQSVPISLSLCSPLFIVQSHPKKRPSTTSRTFCFFTSYTMHVKQSPKGDKHCLVTSKRKFHYKFLQGFKKVKHITCYSTTKTICKSFQYWWCQKFGRAQPLFP